MKLLFVLPEDNEVMIAAIAAITAYVSMQTKLGKRVKVYLVGKENWITRWVIPPQWMLVDSIDSVEGPFDIALDMTKERAEQIATATGKSCASAFGIMLGFEGVNELPKINKSDWDQLDVCILGGGLEETARLLYNAIPNRFQCLTVKLPETDNLLDVMQSKMIVGMRSELTYLAASMGKAVLELYPLDEYEKSFLAKWSSANYWMLALESRSSIDDSWLYLWKGFERIVNGPGRRIFQSS